ncbi:MAG: SRPBCC family protein [Acidobacteriota bacterium]
MVKKVILGGLALIIAIVVVFCVVVAMQPADFRIERTTTIAAAPDKVFEQVNDFHKWEAWSPWAKIDPSMTTAYSGPPSGVGSHYSWVGNDQVGAGNMEITASHPNERIAIDIQFLKPFEAKNMTEFTFKADGNKSVVTWSMAGKNNFIAKAFGMVMNMDKLVGADFEKGLGQLKTIVESGSGPVN